MALGDRGPECRFRCVIRYAEDWGNRDECRAAARICEIHPHIHTTIRRMWVAFGLQPHRSQTFQLSNDPLFVDKVRDIVGLYLSPPNRALILSIDEAFGILFLWSRHFTKTHTPSAT